jgi:hypothetical protein
MDLDYISTEEYQAHLWTPSRKYGMFQTPSGKRRSMQLQVKRNSMLQKMTLFFRSHAEVSL